MENNLSILVVDDDLNFAESTLDILVEMGYECVMVHNGEEALDKLKEEGFHILLSDIKMPVMNGVDLVRVVKDQYPDMKIILMTAFRDETLMQEARAENVDHIVHKPIDINHLITIIKDMQKGVE